MRLDLHVHSENSSDSDMTLKEIEQAALERGLDGIALTDHNELTIFRSKKILIIPGEEVATSSGEVIGLGLRKKIEKDLTPEETIRQIHEQGGIAIAPHPFDYFRSGLGLQLEHLDIDAVETLNARCLFLKPVKMAEKFADEKGLPKVGGSDAHTQGEIGNAYTELRCEKKMASILNAVKNGRTNVFGKLSSPLVHINSYVARFKKRI